MITDAELLELELLLIKKYENHVFEDFYFNDITNEIISSKKDLEPLLSVHYPGRYRIFRSKVVISESLFNLVRMRYFPLNGSVVIKEFKLPNTTSK